MARRAKTVIGKGQTREMLSAASSGTQARQRATEGLAQETGRTGQTLQRGGAQLGQALSKHEAQQSADEAQTRQLDIQEKAQQDKAGLGERQQGLREQKFEAELADKGIERTAPGAGPQDPGAERAGAVEQEMAQGEQQPPLMPTPDQQRMAEQGEKPLEMPTARGGFVQSEARQEAEQQKRETARVGQAANLMRAQTAYRKAFFGQDKEAQEQAEKQLSAPVRQINVKMERLVAGLQDRSKMGAVDWGGLKEAYGDNPDVAQEIENKGTQGASKIIRLLRNEMSFEGMKFIAATGKTPGEELWDPTSPMGRQLTEEINFQGQLMATLTGGFGVLTLAEKNRQLYQRAAQKILMSMQMEQSDQPAGPMPPPPTFGGGGGGAPGQDPSPVFSQQHPGYEPREGPDGGRGQAVRGLSPAERQRSEQITGREGPPQPAGVSKPRGRRDIGGGGGSSK